jgi:hypothetical protein
VGDTGAVGYQEEEYSQLDAPVEVELVAEVD